MDGFHTFSTDNRKKFIDQAKKKKQVATAFNNLTSSEKDIIKIQAVIRKFICMNKMALITLTPLQLTQLNRQILTKQQVYQILSKLFFKSQFLFNRTHKAFIINCQNDINSKLENKDCRGVCEVLGCFCNKISLIFDLLPNKTLDFWVNNVLKYCPDFSLNVLSQKQTKRIFDVITKKRQNFINLIGSIDNKSQFAKQIVYLVCSYPVLNQKKMIEQQQQQNLIKSPINKAYQTVINIISGLDIYKLGKYPIFLLKTLTLMLNALTKQCKLQIMKSYKINPILLKSQGQMLNEVIEQKQQWQCFLDYLDLSNKFNISAVRYFIEMNDLAQSINICDYISTILDILPIQFELKIELDDFMACFNKLSDWIKVHQITTSEEQQKILLSLLMIIYRKLFKMTDKEFINFIKNEGQSFQRILKDRLIKIIYKVILISKVNPIIEKITKICVDLLDQIYNRIFRTGVLSTQIFVNETMTKKLVSYVVSGGDSQIGQFLQKFPFVFSIKTRARKFRQYVNKYAEHFYNEDYYQMMEAGKIKIRRGYEFQDAFDQLNNKDIRRGFSVAFINQFGQQQIGVDAGGLTKQFINRVLKAAFRSQFGMFWQNSQKQLLPHPQKSQLEEGIIAKYYQFIGKMIGKALFQGITIGPKFCGPFLNAIIGKKNNFDDLRKIDKQLYNSLTYIKTMQQDAKDLYLTFQYKDQNLNKFINLKKNGHKIKVDNENKDQYISLLANYKVNKLLQFQSRHIRKGLKMVINPEVLFMFNYEQLNYLISGSGQIRIHELRTYARYSGYNENDLTIKLFWSVVQEFDQETKSNLLMFVTSCPRPSFLGFEDLSPPFTIVKKLDKESLPVSHTCSNVLELPDYRNRQLLKEKLKMAINSCSGFDIA